MARAEAAIGAARYAVSIRTGNHQLVADEPQKLGGGDAGPAPYDLLLASLGACTAITLKMYAERKQWPLAEARVALHYLVENGTGRIERVLTLDGPLDADQRARLADIAERTPVTLTLKSGLAISTSLA
ncbi:OsmC family protein [Tistrella mobilis]|uniref:OsmC family protein n=1 Tax=Tistrella mobilis TaxID=171437 RepID=UPI003558B848